MVQDRSLRFFRWVEKYYCDNIQVIRKSVEDISKELYKIGFELREELFIGGKSQINSINFERHKIKYVEYIPIIFDKRNPLRFYVDFGVRENFDPFRWIKAGSLVKRQTDDMSAKWWGAGWLSFNKEEKFKRDWRKFISRIYDIKDFLETGYEAKWVRASQIGGKN